MQLSVNAKLLRWRRV